MPDELLSSPAPTSTSQDPPTTPNSGFRTNSRLLPHDTEKVLLRLLLSGDQLSKFSQVCNRNQYLFGTNTSDFRKKVQNRRDYLLRIKTGNPAQFIQLLRERELTGLADDCQHRGLLEQQQHEEAREEQAET
jgi:hypothetical protein